jgi:hypothetical protein
MSVTFATSHWFRSPLKLEAPRNTVVRKEGWLYSHSTRARKVGGRRRQVSPNYIHHCTKPNPQMSLLQSQNHVQVTLSHPQTYVSTWSNVCCSHESDNFHKKQSCTVDFPHPKHSPLHCPYITPSKRQFYRKFRSQKAWNLIKKFHIGKQAWTLYQDFFIRIS